MTGLPKFPSGGEGVARAYGGRDCSVHLRSGSVVFGVLTAIDGYEGTPTSITMNDTVIIPWLNVDYIAGGESAGESR